MREVDYGRAYGYPRANVAAEEVEIRLLVPAGFFGRAEVDEVDRSILSEQDASGGEADA